MPAIWYSINYPYHTAPGWEWTILYSPKAVSSETVFLYLCSIWGIKHIPAGKTIEKETIVYISMGITTSWTHWDVSTVHDSQ